MGVIIRRGILVLGLATALLVVACASGAPAQPSFRVGIVRPVPASTGNVPFNEALAAQGFTVGDNLEYVQEDPDSEVLVTPEEVTAAVKGWLAEGIDLIVAFSSAGAEAAAQAAPNTPILFLVNDPVAIGLVKDKGRPDRNLTGTTFRVPADRTLSLARQAIPGLARIGVLVPAADPAGPPSRDAVLVAAKPMGIETVVEAFADEQDIQRAVAALHAQRIDALVVVNAPTSVRFMSVIEPAATALGLPTVANTSLATRALVVLEPNVNALLKRMGQQAARLLAGAAPADVPVEDPVEFRVILNRAVARELGVPDFSIDLVRQADVVAG